MVALHLLPERRSRDSEHLGRRHDCAARDGERAANVTLLGILPRRTQWRNQAGIGKGVPAALGEEIARRDPAAPASATARSIRFLSSRTLPGQVC